MSKVFPILSYRDARAAVDWLVQAFGFEKGAVHEDPEGTIAHAELTFGEGVVMLGNERPQHEERGYGSHAGQGWIYVAVDGDIDAHHERARAAGAEIVEEPFDTDYGSRDYSARDPEGNLWSFGTYRPE